MRHIPHVCSSLFTFMIPTNVFDFDVTDVNIPMKVNVAKLISPLSARSDVSASSHTAIGQNLTTKTSHQKYASLGEKLLSNRLTFALVPVR